MAHASARPSILFTLQLFGAFHLSAGGETIRLPRRKVEALLAYLVVRSVPQGHTREQLAALFWGDTSDDQARTSLRTSLAVLRKTLGSDAILADRERVELNPNFPLRVDVLEFLQACSTAPERAVELYCGDLLPELYDDWVLAERERLRDRYIKTLLRLTQQMRSHSEYEHAIHYARLVLASEPANETAHQHLMFCEMARGNRLAALDQYEACARALRDELAVEPSPETQALSHWIKQTPTLTSSDAARITNLPVPHTSFVGRKPELGQVKALFLGSRLLTLTGAGGSGKTRLAIQMAMDLLSGFRDGVWIVELASIVNPTLVAQSVAKTLGISEKPRQTQTEAILTALRGKQLILILDNCEHLTATCAELADAILSNEACGNVKILATSREPLAIAGESVWHVPTLTVPPFAPTREQLMLTYESVQLFVERARAVNARFELTADNLNAVTQICRRLDGIPLAIELAAARTAVLSAQEIAARLDDRFSLLTGGNRTALPRQQTLRALVDWSYELLSPTERTLFCRLAVFSGGRTLPAIETVCAFGSLARSQILDLVARLVAKSLLVREQATSDGETRYGFLDTIKQYACEKLEQSGQADEVRQHHLDYFLQWAEQIAPELNGARQIAMLQLVEREHANLRVALRFAMERQQHEYALRLGNALSEFWDVRGYLTEGREVLRRMLEASRPTFEHTLVGEFGACYGWAQVNAATLAAKQGDLEAAIQLAETSRALFDELGDEPGIVTVLNLLGSIARMQSAWALARERFEECISRARALRDKRHLATALRNLGIITESLGNYAQARQWYEESLQLSRESDDSRAIATTLNNLGNIAQQQGDYATARVLYDQVLAVYRAAGAVWSVAATLTNLGNLAHSQADYTAAREFHEEGLRIMRAIGDKRGIAVVLNNLGNATLALGDFPAARKLHEEGLRLRRELNDRRGIAMVLSNLGDVAAGAAQYAEAQRFYAEGLVGLRELGDKRTIANCLIGVAQITAQTYHPQHAAQLAGGIHAILATLDAQIDARERGRYEHAQQLAREQLGAAEYANAWAQGVALTPEQTIALAIGGAP